MKYAVSDLHGCYDKYLRLLQKIGFSDEDELYVLGDVCDRGEGGMEILLDMMKRPNVIPLKGNHDYLAARLLPKLKSEYGEDELSAETLKLMSLWRLDGADATISGFCRLTESLQRNVLAYLRTFQYYEITEAGCRKFFLSHTLPSYDENKYIFDYSIMEFVVGEPDYEKTYVPDMITVTGHTPTMMLNEDGRAGIYRNGPNIVIDCGAVFGHPLGCLCLDNMEEIYVD